LFRLRIANVRRGVARRQLWAESPLPAAQAYGRASLPLAKFGVAIRNVSFTSIPAVASAQIVVMSGRHLARRFFVWGLLGATWRGFRLGAAPATIA
jgi:hypothetical protein